MCQQHNLFTINISAAVGSTTIICKRGYLFARSTYHHSSNVAMRGHAPAIISINSHSFPLVGFCLFFTINNTKDIRSHCKEQKQGLFNEEGMFLSTQTELSLFQFSWNQYQSQISETLDTYTLHIKLTVNIFCNKLNL